MTNSGASLNVPAAGAFGGLASGSTVLPPPVPSGQVKCSVCPSYLDVNKQAEVFGKSIGAPVCGLKQIPITRPGKKKSDQDEYIMASTCKDFGKARTFSNSSTTPIEIEVAFPDGESQSRIPEQQNRVLSCSQCEWFVDEAFATPKTGFRAGFCKAKGALLFSDRLSRYAEKCPDRSLSSTGGYTHASQPSNWKPILFPMYLDPANKADPVLQMKKKLGGEVHDPRTFTSNKRISDEARRLGVRTWEPIEDQRGYGPTVYLPVFDLHSIDTSGMPDWWSLEEELKKVPQMEDADRPHRFIDYKNLVYETTVAWVMLKQTPVLWGPAGVGKTEFFRHMSWRMQLPFVRISITNRTDVDDLIGKMLYHPEKGTYFHYGRFTKAWASPGVCLLDEPNTAPPEVWQQIRPTTDNSAQLVIDQDRGQGVKGNRAGYLGMAMNPSWDPLNIGALAVADPDLSRVTHTHLDLPPEEIEKGILLQAMLDDGWEDNDLTHKRINTLMQCAKDIRALVENGAISMSWGIRNQIKTLQLVPFMPWEVAFRRGAADALEPSERDALLDSVRSIVPND